MQNIIDYLEWRGDLSFARDGFNEVDNLIMSSLAYLNFDGIVPAECDRPIALSDAARQYDRSKAESSLVEHNQYFKKLPELLSKAADSARYKDIQLSGYENQIDYEQSKQFSAVVFSINSQEHFIAFRGTDDTLAGWQENLRMSFMNEIQAQRQAVVYLNKVFPCLSGRLYLGGHSKGGNLAVYAATHAARETQDRIIGIYNNDGPGFLKNVIESEGYQSEVEKINTLIPQFSVVGMLLEHGEQYRVVSSSETGVMQHDAFSWEVKGTGFVYEKGLTKESLSLNNTVRAWLDKLSMEERAEFVDALFNIIGATGAKTIQELSKERLLIADTVIKTYKNMDALTQSHLKKAIDMFFRETQKTLKSSLKNDMDALLSKNKKVYMISNTIPQLPRGILRRRRKNQIDYK